MPPSVRDVNVAIRESGKREPSRLKEADGGATEGGGPVLAVVRSIEKYMWLDKALKPSLNARGWWTMGSHRWFRAEE